MNLAELIREIGRGAAGSRALDRATSRELFGAILDGEVPDLELGAILAALRMKGEAADELEGFLAAASQRLPALPTPPAGMPVILPSYNGARRAANLTPLLALALRELGVPVLVHGAAGTFGRVTSIAVFAALGVSPAAATEALTAAMERGEVGLATIDALFPALARLLALRARLGLRSAAHSIVKLLDPFADGGLLLTAGTHPPYLESMRQILLAREATGLLLRATEGEPYANPRRRPAMELVRGTTVETLVMAEHDSLTELPMLPESIDAVTTAGWIRGVLDGDVALPAPLACQLACCLVGVARVASLTDGLARVGARFRIAGELPE